MLGSFSSSSNGTADAWGGGSSAGGLVGVEKDAAEAGFRSGRETDGARASSADARGGVRGVAIRARARTREGARHVQASLAALAQEHADHALVLGVILFSKERRATVGSAKDEAGGRRGHGGGSTRDRPLGLATDGDRAPPRRGGSDPPRRAARAGARRPRRTTPWRPSSPPSARRPSRPARGIPSRRDPNGRAVANPERRRGVARGCVRARRFAKPGDVRTRRDAV